MGISRREILKLIGVTALGGGVTQATQGIASALVERESGSPLIWINEGGDDHNLLAQLGRSHPDLLGLIAGHWDLRDFAPLMPTGYQYSNKKWKRAPVLILENVPGQETGTEGANGKIIELLPVAKVVILLGTDACFGGMLQSPADVGRFEALCKQHKTPLIKLPGLPVPPHHLVGTLGHLEFFGFPKIDAHRRPILYYGETVCRQCEYRDDLETGRFTSQFGEAGCLLHLGCKGPVTHNSCSTERWNNGENWCVGAGGPCTGCSEPGFPDHGGLNLYGRLSGGTLREHSVVLQHLDGIGLGLLGLTGAGIGLHLTRRMLFPHDPDESPSPPRKLGDG